MDAVDTGTALADPPSNPAPGPPPRRPGSIRRTSTMLMTWPGGFGTQLRLSGRARDLLTPHSGDPEVLAFDELEVGVGADRTIEDVAASPARPALAGLVGARAGAGLRGALSEVAPDELEGGTPLYLLLDDLAGASLIAGFAWSRWTDAWMGSSRDPDGVQPARADPVAVEIAPHPRIPPAPRRTMIGICAGFRPGSGALAPDGTPRTDRRHNVAAVPPIAEPTDPWSWHELPSHPPVAMRRARRIDVWRDGGNFAVDAMFRDSCWQPDALEVAVHEYELHATIDAATGTVTALRAQPRVLPYAECPTAAPNATWMVGATARRLRREVLSRLRATDSCTHLNDALRSLAEVPVLAASLDSTFGAFRQSMDSVSRRPAAPSEGG